MDREPESAHYPLDAPRLLHRLRTSVLVLLLTPAGCAATLPNQTEAGTAALLHMNAALATLPAAERDPSALAATRREAQACYYSMNDLISSRSFLDGKPLYDPNTATLSTAQGQLTLKEVQKRCKDMTMERTTELPGPGARDPRLERTFLEVAQEGAQPSVCRAVVILEPDWLIQRHPMSGIVVSRKRWAAVAFSHPDSTCSYTEISFREEYVGGQFGMPMVEDVGAKTVLNCQALEGRKAP
jgi:hypothetical protein